MENPKIHRTSPHLHYGKENYKGKLEK
ncbi:hypothetical protein Taro_002058 [Colocasia esculenta]|uniref:Uncharacterized protein n=1 Tax=Colocasia esculenta TaxID=4460 RepID=A0A843TJS7_COLES|nr:hypothetical protein [Colocasia esculenta]